MLLAYEGRFDKDHGAFGGLFYQCCEEVDKISFAQSFNLIMDLLVETLRETLYLSDEEIDRLVEKLMENLPIVLRKGYWETQPKSFSLSNAKVELRFYKRR